MDSKLDRKRLALLACLVGTAVLSFDAGRSGLWGNFALFAVISLACVVSLARRKTEVVPEPISQPTLRARDGEPYSVLIEQVPIPLLRFSQDGGLQAVNSAARNLFHADEVIVDAPVALMEAIEKDEPGVRSAIILFDRPYAMGLSEIVVGGESLKLISLADIAPEMRMAEATALRDLLRVLSHEIMNSLTPVASLAGIAQSYIDGARSADARAASEALDVLRNRTRHLARFVEAYRALARLPEPMLRPVEGNVLLRDILRVFEQSPLARGVDIEWQPSSPSVRLDIDEGLVAQALLNVLTNAAEAFGETEKPRRIRLSIEAMGEDIHIMVADNGPGIPLDLREQIFHAFVTTKPQGTGTGLNLARQIALAHGGDLVLHVTDEPWQTVFCFAFRRAAGRPLL